MWSGFQNIAEKVCMARKKVIVNSIKKWAKIKDISIIEGHACVDHIHLCLGIPPKFSVSSIMGILKGKSASEVMTFGNKTSRMSKGRSFWARGYCVSTVGLDENMIRNYIKNQEAEDKKQDQLNLI